MKTSTQYKETLRKKFKYSQKPWESSLGISYIGYNHQIKKKEEFTKALSRKDALVLFNKDIVSIEKVLNKSLGKNIEQKHFDIMVSLCYDVGTKAVRNSMFFNYYLSGDTYNCFNYYMNWSKYKGKYSQSLYNRRKEELKYITIQG